MVTFTIEGRTGQPDTAVSCDLMVHFVHGRWEARGQGFLGQGSSRDAAIVNWIAYRIGIMR